MATKKPGPRVAVVMGSKSDWDVMARVRDTLAEFDVECVCRVLSAHRTPEALVAWIKACEDDGVQVFVAGAGMSAALPGVVAAHTLKPVVGVPLESGSLGGQDALHSVVQMPPGIPVGCVAIGKPGATNAALLAVQILSLQCPSLVEKLGKHRAAQAEKILGTALD